MCPTAVTNPHIQHTDNPDTRRSIEDHTSHHTIISDDHHEESEQHEESINDGAYWTEGIRNPGWVTVAGIWMMYFVSTGTVNSWGVFQAEYIKLYSNEIAVSFIGSMTSAITQLGILITPLIRRLGVRYTMLLGALVSTVALILASFATKLWQLFATQGFMYGIGLCLVFNTPTTLSSQWFVKKRAYANGIAWSGATIGPMIFANSFQALLKAFGRQMTLAIMAGVVFVSLLASAILSRPRYPVIRQSPKSHPPNKKAQQDEEKLSSEKCSNDSLLSMRYFLILLLSFTFPFHWQTILFLAPSYAQYVGASPALAASITTIIFAMASISRIMLGFIADRCGRLNMLSITLSINAIFIMTLWHYANTIPLFAIFCGFFGLLGGLFPNMRPVVVSDLVGMRQAQKAISWSYLLSVPGSLVGDPFISYLYSHHGWTVAIQIAGAIAAISSIAALVVRFLTNKRLFAIV